MAQPQTNSTEGLAANPLQPVPPFLVILRILKPIMSVHCHCHPVSAIYSLAQLFIKTCSNINLQAARCAEGPSFKVDFLPSERQEWTKDDRCRDCWQGEQWGLVLPDTAGQGAGGGGNQLSEGANIWA